MGASKRNNIAINYGSCLFERCARFKDQHRNVCIMDWKGSRRVGDIELVLVGGTQPRHGD